MGVKNKPGVIRNSSMDPGGEFLVWNGEGYTYEASKADAIDTAKAIWGKDVPIKLMGAVKGHQSGGKIMQGYKAGGRG